MPTATTTYALSKPTVGGDADAWGGFINTNFDTLDDLLDGTTAIKPNLDAGLWKVGGVAVTSTAAELNILDGVTASTAELNYLDITTLGTSQASKAVTADANGDVVLAGEVTFGKGIKETVFALSGTTPALDASNGTIQTWTLTGNSSPTDSLAAGESLTLMIDDGTAYTITWPSVTWLVTGGAAPTLATTGYTVIVLWKVGSTLYGKY